VQYFLAFPLVPLLNVCTHLLNQDLRIQELNMELQVATGIQRIVTSSSTAAAPFPSASSAQSAPGYVATPNPSAYASTPNSSTPSVSDDFQKTASTRVESIAPLKQSSSGGDAKSAPVQSTIHTASLAGRAMIPSDQDYHPAYQLHQYRQPAQSKDQYAATHDLPSPALLQSQVAGLTSPLSGQVYSQQAPAAHLRQSGQHALGNNPTASLPRPGASLQEQLAEVQKQLQLLSSAPRVQSQPSAQQYSHQQIQFNADTQWGTASGADEIDEKLQFFA